MHRRFSELIARDSQAYKLDGLNGGRLPFIVVFVVVLT